MKLFLHVSSHFECEKLSKKIERKTLEFMWESSAIGPSPLFLPAALLFLSYFITMYLVWQIRNSMPSWRPGGRKLRCLSWCARSSPLRTERSGWVCESAACRPSLTEERVLSGWKKEKTNENSKRNNAKGKRNDFQDVSESVYEYEKGHHLLVSRISFPNFHASKGFLIQ